MSHFNLSIRGSVSFLEALPLADCNFISHAFCTREKGVSRGPFGSLNFSMKEGDGAEEVRKNWELLLGAFKLDNCRLTVMSQVHGDRILNLDRADGKEKGGYDALITSRPGVVIGIKTADCVPLLLLDKARRVIAAVHAGWRGTALNIAGQVIDAFVKDFSSRPQDILAAIGPAIGNCCYQVDSHVYQALADYAKNGAFSPSFSEKDRWMLDLSLINGLQLEQRGLPSKNIFSARKCTSCHRDVFYSHRRDGAKTGRHFNFIMLRTEKTL